MTKDNRSRLSCYTPRIYNLKRVMDVTHPGISGNKKQVVESAIKRPNFMQRSVYPLDKVSNYPLITGQVRGELVLRPSQFLYMANSSLGAKGTSARRNDKDFKNAHQGDASAHFHNLGEILKAKVNDIHDFENVISMPMSNFLRITDDGRLLKSAGYNKYCGSFLSLGHLPQNKDGSNTTMDVIPNEGLDLRLTLGRNYKENIVSGKADGPKHASGITIADNRAIVDHSNYAHLSGATRQTNIVELNAHQNNIPLNVILNGGCNVNRTLGYNGKEKGNIVVFGGDKVTANDEVRVYNHNSAQSLGATSWVGTVKPNAHPSLESNSNPASTAEKQKTCRRKKSKTAGPHPNACLLSIHCLLSTGIFNGAMVNYILRRRDIVLGGVIKGSKILCSCNECNNSKYISPYSFELHAGGRTKHPNTHIYFENGKSVYEVFQELRDTPENMLFDAIPKIAGSAVSRLHFHLWKASYPAATLALQQNNAFH